MTEREQQILAILRHEPLIAQQALADRLGISRSAAAGHIMNLVQKGHILGKGYVLAEQRFVIALGAANMDIAGSAGHPLVTGDSIPGQVRTAPGGVARNVAENLARLGHDVRLLTAVGADLHGRSLLEDTARAGVDVRSCWVLEDARTSTYLSLHGPDGDMALAINDMAILERITPERLSGQAERLRHAGAVLVDCNLGEDALAWTFAHTHDTDVFVDPVSAFKSRRILPWLSRIHTLKANRLEAQTLCGQPVDDDHAVVQAARWLHVQGVRQVVLSLGARGAYWSQAGGAQGWQPGVPVETVSATGAGDALMAGLLHGHLTGMALAEAVQFATGCAALTLRAPQANHASLSVATVQQLLAQHHA
jgi:pseudouridine kinase